MKKLTRAECIRALKESPVYVKMRIRHYFPNNNSAGYQLAAKAKVLSHFRGSRALPISIQSHKQKFDFNKRIIKACVSCS